MQNHYDLKFQHQTISCFICGDDILFLFCKNSSNKFQRYAYRASNLIFTSFLIYWQISKNKDQYELNKKRVKIADFSIVCFFKFSLLLTSVRIL